MQTQKISISMRALIQRINRVLAKDNEVLKKSRSSRTSLSVGEYFVLDIMKNFISRTQVDPEQLGRKLGVLKLYEEVGE